MASSSTPAPSRWQPAVLAVSVASAALALWYLRQQNAARHSTQPAPALHRSNAIRRRTTSRARRRRNSGAAAGGSGGASGGGGGPAAQETQLDIPDRFEAVSVARLQQLIEALPDTFTGDIPTVPGPVGEVQVSMGGLRVLRRTEASGESPTEVDEQSAFYEFALLREALRRALPRQARLRDPAGLPGFLHMLRRLGFYDMQATCVALVGAAAPWLTDFDQGRRYAAENEMAAVTYESRQNVSELVRPFWSLFLPDAEDSEVIDTSDREAFLASLAQPRPDSEADSDDQSEAFVDEDDMDLDDDDDDDDDDDTEASWDFDGGADGDGEARKDGQSLLNMLYHIAEDQSRRDGYVHRGVSCNQCSAFPIRGVRYRCSNCPDFDLCEPCEALQTHPKTHLLYKIRIPAPFLDSLQPPQAPRYPGKMGAVMTHLPRSVSKALSQEIGREPAEIEALWDTFKCLANADWPADPLRFGFAVDRECFDQCFLPSTARTRRPPNLPIHDRLFAFFDADANGLVGFREFVEGVAAVRTRDRDARIRRCFWVYDADGDGLIGRTDFLTMFKSYFAFSRELTLDMLDNMEEDVLEGASLRDSLQGTQPISSTYTAAIPHGQWRRSHSGKMVTADGDRVVMDGRGATADPPAPAISRGSSYLQIVADIREEEVFGDVCDVAAQRAALAGEEWESAADVNEATVPLLNDLWPPDFVCLHDAESFFDSTVPFPTLKAVVDRSVRRRIVEKALDDRQRVRDEAVAARQARMAFYGKDHGGDDRVRGATDSSESSDNAATPTSAESPTAETRPRAPPPHPDNAAQEYLFEILQESLNEMLDTLFRQREDLSLAAQRSAPRRRAVRGALDAYGARAGTRALCAWQVSSTELLARASEERGGFSDADVAAELQRVLCRQQDPSEPEFHANLNQELACGVIDGPEHLRRLALRAPAPPAGEASAPEASAPEAAQAQPVESESRVQLAVVAPPPADGLRAATMDYEQLRAGLANEWGGAEGDMAAANASLGPLLAAGANILATYGGSVFEAVEDDNSEDTDGGGDRSASEAEARPAADSAIDLLAPPAKKDAAAAQHRDPTMPQNMPDRAAKGPAPQRSEPPSERELKFLLMMECVEEEDGRRGGPGRIRLDEFEKLMAGPRGRRLDFLGMFFDLVTF